MYKHYDDLDVWGSIPKKYLWAVDKLILSKQLGYVCGPKGVAIPQAGEYIIRPCVNFLGMGRGVFSVKAHRSEVLDIPDGFFWCEKFTGEHLSIDFKKGKQFLTILGVPRIEDSIKYGFAMWKVWKKVRRKIRMPKGVAEIIKTCPYVNVECVGGKVIEVHFRLNPDFKETTSEYLKPVYYSDVLKLKSGEKFILAVDRISTDTEPLLGRLGFIAKA